MGRVSYRVGAAPVKKTLDRRAEPNDALTLVFVGAALGVWALYDVVRWFAHRPPGGVPALALFVGILLLGGWMTISSARKMFLRIVFECSDDTITVTRRSLGRVTKVDRLDRDDVRGVGCEPITPGARSPGYRWFLRTKEGRLVLHETVAGSIRGWEERVRELEAFLELSRGGPRVAEGPRSGDTAVDDTSDERSSDAPPSRESTRAKGD